MSTQQDSSFTGTTYTLEQFPDPASIYGGAATLPLDFPHIQEVVGQTQGTALWPQQVQYTGSPISAMVYSPSNSSYDKNTLPTIDNFMGQYNPTAGLLQPPSLPVSIPSTRSYSPLAWWKIAIIGGLSATGAVLFAYYIYLHIRK